MEATEAEISSEESSTVVTVAQLGPASVTRPTTWPYSVMATSPGPMPELVPLPMVKALFQLLASHETM